MRKYLLLILIIWTVCIVGVASCQIRIQKIDAAKLGKEDPIQHFTAFPDAPEGILAYTANVPWDGQKDGFAPYFLVLRSTQGLLAGGSRKLVFQVTPTDANVIFGCQISPDRTQLLFRKGWPYDRGGSFQLCLLKLQTQHLEVLPLGLLRSPRIEWSPDSKHVAYLQGGDIYGNADLRFGPFRLYIYDLVTKHSIFVAQNSGVGHFAWTRKNMLLYTMEPVKQPDVNVALPRPLQSPDKANALQDNASQPHPAIFEISAEGGRGKRVTDGYVFSASPDGALITLWGSANTEVPKPKNPNPKIDPLQKGDNTLRHDANNKEGCVS